MIVGEWTISKAELINFPQLFDKLVENESANLDLDEEQKIEYNEFLAQHKEMLMKQMEQDLYQNFLKGKVFNFMADKKVFFEDDEATWSIDPNDNKLIHFVSKDDGKGKIEIDKLTNNELEAVFSVFIDDNEDLELRILVNLVK